MGLLERNCALLLLCTALLSAQPPTITQSEGCCKPRRPETIKRLPISIRRQLVQAGCLVAQNSDEPQPNNVLKGSFAAPGQTDWAVLCLKPNELSIRIFWGGPASCESKLVLTQATKKKPFPADWQPETFLWVATKQKIKSYNDF